VPAVSRGKDKRVQRGFEVMHEACIMPQPRFSPSCVREQQPDLAAGNEEVAREALAPLSAEERTLHMPAFTPPSSHNCLPPARPVPGTDLGWRCGEEVLPSPADLSPAVLTPYSPVLRRQSAWEP
jgi:hypothetical protein